MKESRFVWLNDSPSLRNQFARFERTFDLKLVPPAFTLHLFADTRYRLRVNGEFVATGPGRFVTQFPEFDTRDLTPFLRQGENTISVEVNFFGASSFQSMPDGKPGFIAWGGGEHIDLSTPGDWKGFRLDAWRCDAPLFSFAQNPVEICSTLESEKGKPTPIISLTGEAAPWGRLEPYSGQLIPFSIHRPKCIELVGRLENHEDRIGFMSHDPDAHSAIGRQKEKPWNAFATWILSPCEQSVTLSCFWSELYCNGLPVEVDTHTPRGNHGQCDLKLKQGWNLLTGKIHILTEFWAYCLGIPAKAGLSLHGRRDISCEAPLAISPNATHDSLHLPTPGDSEAPLDWTLHNGNSQALTPARLMAWDLPAADSVRKIEPGRLAEFSMIEAREATWCFSFAGEFLGHAVLDVEAPEGSVLDVACDDWQAPHGGLALYQSNPFTDSADRFILRGGPQRVELFHPRGGKFLQVTLRSPEGISQLSLHDVFIRSRQALGENRTRFSSNSEVLDWTWSVAMRTLIDSTDDSYSDCPWRERGTYIGDAYVNQHLNFLLNSNHRTSRRTIRLFAQSQLPDGQLACCAPSWLRLPHEDYTLIWLLALHDFWNSSGDLTLADELWPTVKKIWASSTWDRHPSGLWNTIGKRVFLDWGVIPAEREGRANASLNILRFHAAKSCAKIASALGKTAEAAAFLNDAHAVEAALFNLLWDEEKGRLLPSLDSTTPAVHANTLALAFGLGDSETRNRILTYLEPQLRKNFSQGIRNGQSSGHLELYFLHYALPALADHGRPDLAELLIEQHYGFLRSLGDDSLPECFCRVHRSVGSRCHSWSAAPAIYAARYVLGIRSDAAGNPKELLFDPIVHNINRASGRISHPEGWIEVSWELENGVIREQISAPESVLIRKREPTSKRDMWCLRTPENSITTNPCKKKMTNSSELNLYPPTGEIWRPDVIARTAT